MRKFSLPWNKGSSYNLDAASTSEQNGKFISRYRQTFPSEVHEHGGNREDSCCYYYNYSHHHTNTSVGHDNINVKNEHCRCSCCYFQHHQHNPRQVRARGNSLPLVQLSEHQHEGRFVGPREGFDEAMWVVEGHVARSSCQELSVRSGQQVERTNTTASGSECCMVRQQCSSGSSPHQGLVSSSCLKPARNMRSTINTASMDKEDVEGFTGEASPANFEQCPSPQDVVSPNNKHRGPLR
ncbi:uncharacterized protein LOC111086007, partial [Limulus polyphemus]|uniref:Uncharacterized protein LOC111086007 n=1 Tax=Limulus polyphemus TaxID=6850 RepID=A0ABM1SGZ3_LIMPO